MTSRALVGRSKTSHHWATGRLEASEVIFTRFFVRLFLYSARIKLNIPSLLFLSELKIYHLSFFISLILFCTRLLILKSSNSRWHLLETWGVSTWSGNQVIKTTFWASLSCGTVQSAMGRLTSLRTTTSSECHRTPTYFWVELLWRRIESARYRF